jgi:hypothetical protein
MLHFSVRSGGSHPLAAIGTATALGGAILHHLILRVQALAGIGACPADLGADGARPSVEF